MILLIIISMPLFVASTWFTNITSYEKGIKTLESAAAISPSAYNSIDDYYIKYMLGLPSKLIYFEVKVNETCCTFPDNYPNEREKYNISSSEKYRTEELLSYETDVGNTVVF